MPHILFLILLFNLCSICYLYQKYDNITCEISLVSDGFLYLRDQSDLWYKILNYEDYDLVSGKAVVSYYLIDRNTLNLTSYIHIPDDSGNTKNIEGNAENKLNNNNNENLRTLEDDIYGVPSYFDFKFRYCVFWVERPEGETVTLDKLNRFIHYLNLEMFLNSGYRTGIDAYISPLIKCLDDCYEDIGTLMGNATSLIYQYDPNFKKNECSNQLYIADWFGTYVWMGLAAVGTVESMMAKEGNLWSIVRAGTGFYDENVLLVSVHEIGHNYGYGHAYSTNEQTGFINDYNITDTRISYNNYMGNGFRLTHTPDPAQWMIVMNKKKLFYPWNKMVSVGTHKYRLFAWDYPYSRLYLGDDKNVPYDAEDIVDGVSFNKNGMSLTLQYDANTFYSGHKLANYATFTLFYRYSSYGARTHGPRGIIAVSGPTITKPDGSDLYGTDGFELDIDMDDIGEFNAASSILNYLKVPKCDIGTLKFRVTKFHQVSCFSDEDMFNLLETKPDKVDINDVPYVEIEVTYEPNKPFIKPTKISDPPMIVHSPSLSNCIILTGSITCNRFAYSHLFWLYSPPKDNYLATSRYHHNRPRGQSGGIFGVQSHRGVEINNLRIATGEMDVVDVQKFNVTVNTKSMPSDPRFDYNQNCNYYKQVNNDYVLVDDNTYDVLVYTGLDRSLYDSIYLTDNYHNIIPITLIENSLNGYVLFNRPNLNIQGFADMLLTLTKERQIYSQYYFNRFYGVATERIAIRYTHEFIYVESISLINRYTMVTFHGPLNCRSNKWYYYVYVFTHVDDKIFIDFSGEIPHSLIIYFQTDGGIYEKDISFMGGYKDISLIIPMIDIMKNSIGWGELYRFKFNQDVTLLGIRPVSKDSKQELPYNMGRQDFTIPNVNGENYKFTCTGQNSVYLFTPFTANFMNREFNFETADKIFEIKIGSDNVNRITYIISIILILINTII